MLLKLPITPTPSFVLVDNAIVGPVVIDQTTPLLVIEALPSPEIVLATDAEVAVIFETELPEMVAKVFPSSGLLLSSDLEQEKKKSNLKQKSKFHKRLKCFYQGKLIRSKSLI